MPPKKDPVASRSAAIVAHMNKDHEDAVKALTQYHADLDRLPDTAKMLSINASSLEIEYRPTPRTLMRFAKLEKLTVPFDKPLKADSEARPFLIELCREAEAKRQKNAPILYSVSWDFFLPIIVVGSWLIMRTPAARAIVFSKGFNEYIMEKIGYEEGIETFDYVMNLLVKIHLVEAAGMSAIALRRGASPSVTLAWGVSTFFCGFTQFAKFFKMNPWEPEVQTKKEQ